VNGHANIPVFHFKSVISFGRASEQFFSKDELFQFQTKHYWNIYLLKLYNFKFAHRWLTLNVWLESLYGILKLCSLTGITLLLSVLKSSLVIYWQALVILIAEFRLTILWEFWLSGDKSFLKCFLIIILRLSLISVNKLSLYGSMHSSA